LNDNHDNIRRLGFALIADIVSDVEIATMVADFDQLSAGHSSRRGQVYAARNLLTTVPSVGMLALAPTILALVEPVLGRNPFPVRVAKRPASAHGRSSTMCRTFGRRLRFSNAC
jgi:hypothetical protein